MTDGPGDTITHKVTVEFALTFDPNHYIGVMFFGSTPEEQEAIAYRTVVNRFMAHGTRTTAELEPGRGVTISVVPYEEHAPEGR